MEHAFILFIFRVLPVACILVSLHQLIDTSVYAIRNKWLPDSWPFLYGVHVMSLIGSTLLLCVGLPG